MYADEHKKLSQVKIIYIYIYILSRGIYIHAISLAASKLLDRSSTRAGSVTGHSEGQVQPDCALTVSRCRLLDSGRIELPDLLRLGTLSCLSHQRLLNGLVGVVALVFRGNIFPAAGLLVDWGRVNPQAGPRAIRLLAELGTLGPWAVTGCVEVF